MGMFLVMILQMINMSNILEEIQKGLNAVWL
jgi:hypothetical protein